MNKGDILVVPLSDGSARRLAANAAVSTINGENQDEPVQMKLEEKTSWQ